MNPLSIISIIICFISVPMLIYSIIINSDPTIWIVLGVVGFVMGAMDKKKVVKH